MADNAQPSKEQNLYFDSICEVRVLGRGIAFLGQISIEQASSAKGHQVFSPGTLFFVEKDELEERVAVDISIARGNQKYGEAIQLISLRLASRYGLTEK